MTYSVHIKKNFRLIGSFAKSVQNIANGSGPINCSRFQIQFCDFIKLIFISETLIIQKLGLIFSNFCVENYSSCKHSLTENILKLMSISLC